MMTEFYYTTKEAPFYSLPRSASSFLAFSWWCILYWLIFSSVMAQIGLSLIFIGCYFHTLGRPAPLLALRGSALFFFLLKILI
jgi:hypothetical protein